MTDIEILEILQQILDKIHDPKNGIFRKINLEHRDDIIKQIATIKNIPIKDVRFNVSGREIYEQKLGDLCSCTGMAKVTLYLGHIMGLDMRAVITTDITDLDNGRSNNGHVVPAVKMSDGTYHIFEPRLKNVNAAGFQKMLSQSVEIGKNVFHILNNIKNKPYEIVDIIDTATLENIKTVRDIKKISGRKI